MLGDNIRKYRKLNNMSQDELAEKLNVTRQSISLWENGQTQPTLENIVALAKLFKVSTDELLVADKADLPVANPTPAPNREAPKKPKWILLALGVATVAVAVALLLHGCDDKSKKPEPEPDPSPVTTEGDTQETETEKANTEAASPAQSDTQATTESETAKVTAPTTESTKETSTTTEKDTAADTDKDEKDIYGYLKNFVIKNGTINGDYCYYSESADRYGGYASEDFSLYYWGDTDRIEFCLHSVVDDTFSINFYLYIPEEHSGKYEYVSSYYYRVNGEPLYEAKGTIDAAVFTDRYPLSCSKYYGSTDDQNTFMEISRQGVCDLIACLEKFIEVEQIEYSFEDFGFLNFGHN